jgi:endonuclease G
MQRRQAIIIVGAFVALSLLAIIGAGVAIWWTSQEATRNNTNSQAVPGFTADQLPAALTPGPIAVPGPQSATWTPQPTTVYPVKVLPFAHFTVGYDEAAKSPAWVTYHLAGPITFHERADRPATFQTDFRTAAHVSHGDYTGSGFDRGHLCPSYAMLSRYGVEGMRETFTMANIIPQRHGLNAGEWEGLEEAIAGRNGRGDGWAGHPGGVWVINGPAYDRRPATQTLRNRTWIPETCWSVVLRQRDQKWQALAFQMPNIDNVPGPFGRYLVTIDQVAKASGVDVLAGMPTDQRTRLETQRASEVWR